MYNSVKDTNEIFEKERSKKAVKALIIDAVESHLLKWATCLWNGFHKQPVWSCCCRVLYIHVWSKWRIRYSNASTWTVLMLLITQIDGITERNSLSSIYHIYYFLEIFPTTVTYFMVVIFHIKASSSPLSARVYESDSNVHNTTECTLPHVHWEWSKWISICGIGSITSRVQHLELRLCCCKYKCKCLKSHYWHGRGSFTSGSKHY